MIKELLLGLLLFDRIIKMKYLKNIFATLFVLTITTSIFAVSEETENRLLEQALVEGAVTKEQKTAVQRYFSNLALQKQKEAERYREMAEVRRGGKSGTQDLKKRELLKKAELLESESSSYKELSGSLASISK